MRIEYKTTPMPQYVNRIKTVSMKRAQTEYVCPSCGVHVRKRDFEKHVLDTHKNIPERQHHLQLLEDKHS